MAGWVWPPPSSRILLTPGDAQLARVLSQSLMRVIKVALGGCGGEEGAVLQSDPLVGTHGGITQLADRVKCHEPLSWLHRRQSQEPLSKEPHLRQAPERCTQTNASSLPPPPTHLHPQTPSQRGTWPQNPCLCARRDGGALGKGWAAGCIAPRLTLRGVFCSPTPSRPRPGAGGQRGRHLRSSLRRQGNKRATRGWWALSCSVPVSPAPKLDSGGRSRPLKPPPLTKKPLKE